MLVVLVVIAVVVFLAVAGSGGYFLVTRRRPGPGAEAPPSLRQAPARPATPGRPPAAPARPVRPARPEVEAGPEEGQEEGEGAPAGAVPDLATPPAPPPAPAKPARTDAGPAPQLLDKPRFRDRLGRARELLATQLSGFRGRSKLDQQAWDELEEALILADVGVKTATDLLGQLKQRAREDSLTTPGQLVGALRDQLVGRLEGDRELHRAEAGATTVWLFVGVNGVGKTTTIGKVAMQERASGRKAVMAAGDTFRAAAADQLQLWSERTGAGFVRGNEGGDPGAVVFDAVQHASARGIPLVLADTAGRLHTKVNLMEELKKVRRVADRPPGSVTEVLLVIDATTGQNGLVQARQFTEAVGVTGVVLTKLDGTAKGGIAVAIAGELGIPIKLVGLGEGPEDLVGFDAEEFVDALLPKETAA